MTAIPSSSASTYSQDPNGVLAKHGIPMDKTYFVIWTTTTWTLPANEAICLNGAFEDSFVRMARSTRSWPPSWSRA